MLDLQSTPHTLVSSKFASSYRVNTFICLKPPRGGVCTSVTIQLVPVHEAGPINHHEVSLRMPSGVLTWAGSRRLTHSWLLTSCLPLRTPSAPEGSGKQEPHVSTSHTRADLPPSQPGTASLTSPRQTINY